jgi:hypothetical protein
MYEQIHRMKVLPIVRVLVIVRLFFYTKQMVTTVSNPTTCTGAVKAVEKTIFHSWKNSMNNGHSDTEDEFEEGSDGVPPVGLKDDGDSHEISWDRFETGPGLSAWDQLGEGYEQDAAKVG